MSVSEQIKNRLPEREMLKDWKSIKRSIGMRSSDNLLDAERMRNVIHVFASLSERKGNVSYNYYDMAHLFLLKHMSQALKNRIPSLGRDEKKLGVAILGKVHYNPPATQYSERREAAEKLAKIGKMGNLIFSAIRHEYKKLDRKKYGIGEVPEKFSDMFNNPIAMKCMEANEYYSSEERRAIPVKSVEDFAKLLLRREAREKERKNEA